MVTMLAILLGLLFNIGHGQTLGQDCGEFMNQAECETSSVCEWDEESSIAGIIDCLPQNGHVVQGGCILCTCISDVPLDIIFILDSSGSITAPNFDLEREWLKYIVNGKISPNSRIGFIIFATQVNASRQCAANWPATFGNNYNPPFCFWPPGSLSPTGALMRQPLIDYIDAVRYTGGYTNTQEAMRTAIEWYDEGQSPFRKKLAIILTDGQPYGPNGPEEVCHLENPVKSRGIQVIVVGIGSGWINQNGPAKVSCLTSNPGDMFYVPSFDAIATINPDFIANLCPFINVLVITEVKPDASDYFDPQTNPVRTNRAGDSWRGRFLEAYNTGQLLNMSHLEMTGMVTSHPQNGMKWPVLIPVGTYVVWYEDTQGEYDVSCYECTSCSLVKDCSIPDAYTYTDNQQVVRDWGEYPNVECTPTSGDAVHDAPSETGGGRCGDSFNMPSVYIPCGQCGTGASSYGDWGCCIDHSKDATNWEQWIHDVQVEGTRNFVDHVVYDETDPAWTVAPLGYAYELISKFYDNSVPGNWVFSCYEWGTPGADPVTGCPAVCDDGSCSQRGDTGSNCDNGDGVCDCSEGYYSHGIECKEIPRIGWCTAHWWKNHDDENYWMQFEWSPVLITEKRYQLEFPNLQDSTATRTTNATAKDIYGGVLNQEVIENGQILWQGIYEYPGCVRVIVTDEDGNDVEGPCTNCTVTTSPPTASPTPAPTADPTKAPTNSPTPSPTAGPRSCFWKDCGETFLLNHDYCECDLFAKDRPVSECCVHKDPVSWGWGPETLGDRRKCNYQNKGWFPRAVPWSMAIKCIPPHQPEVVTEVFWEIKLLGSECQENCGNENEEMSTTQYNGTGSGYVATSRRRLRDNVGYVNNTNDTSIDGGGFLISPKSGSQVINGSNIEGLAYVEILVQTTEAAYLDDAEFLSIYVGNMTRCTSLGDGGAPCAPVYPNPIQLHVTKDGECEGTGCGGSTEKSIPPYIWGVIGGLIAFLCCLGILIYFFWWKAAMAKGEIAETKDEADFVRGQLDGDMMDDLQVGDVKMNPLMTGGIGGGIPKNIIQAQIDNLQANPDHENADVIVQQMKYKEEFGQVKGGPGRGW